MRTVYPNAALVTILGTRPGELVDNFQVQRNQCVVDGGGIPNEKPYSRPLSSENHIGRFAVRLMSRLQVPGVRFVLAGGSRFSGPAITSVTSLLVRTHDRALAKPVIVHI